MARSESPSMNRPPPSSPQPNPPGVAQEIDWMDFRDHLSTADQAGRRRWLFPRQPSGRFYRWRTWVSYLLLATMFVGPFVRINGNPLLLFNIVERRFSILGQIFWPQDGAIFALATLLFLSGIFVFTAAFGRLWCGWTCPQTLLMEMVFRKIEYWIEGDAMAQRALRAAPWTGQKLRKKLVKHAVFLSLSFLIGNTLLSYIIGTEQLIQIVTDNPARHLTGLGFMTLFTIIFYAIFARFREQACTFICPYGRLQSTVVDENTLVVAYDHRRGEQRSRLHRNQKWEHRHSEGYGDCIDCRQCVRVCPTGIDIRNGTQMECVHCTACIDACDAVMDKLGQARGLVRYASLNSVERAQPFRITARMIGYSAVLGTLAVLLGYLVFTRSDVQTTLLRAPGALFQQTPEGRISNLYLLKLVNKTSRDVAVTLKLQSVSGKLLLIGGHDELVVPRGELAQTSVLIELPPETLQASTMPLSVDVCSKDKVLETINTVFIGPRK
ncbi:MAG: cytochrome c oxidase accessory protein CcoG [Verrucomicrobiota bacterium]